MKTMNKYKTEHYAELVLSVIDTLREEEMTNHYVTLVYQDKDSVNAEYNSDSIAQTLHFHSARQFQKIWGSIKNREATDVNHLQVLREHFKDDKFDMKLLSLIQDMHWSTTSPCDEVDHLLPRVYWPNVETQYLYVIVTRFGTEPFPNSSTYVFNLEGALKSMMQYGTVKNIHGLGR